MKQLKLIVKLSEKIGYGLGDAAAGGITWKVMSIAFPFFFTNFFGLTVADALYTVRGSQTTLPYIEYKDIVAGGTLEFEMQ